MTPFVVLTSPRSGSGWLIDLLNSHPAIVAHAELFHTERRTAPDYYGARDLPYFEAHLASQAPSRRRLTTLATVCCKRSPIRVAHQVSYLSRVYARRAGVGAIGFKLTYVQASANPALLPLLSLRRARVVHLIRANLLAAAISSKAARESGIYHVRRGELTHRGRLQQTVASDLLVLDARRLRSELEDREAAIARARRRLERLRLRTLEIGYEELVGREDETLARILGFLGLEPQVELLESALVRARAGSPLDLLENADDVRAALAGTRFEWMLAAA